MALTVLLGGARSGKSRLAIEAMAARIAAHCAAAKLAETAALLAAAAAVG